MRNGNITQLFPRSEDATMSKRSLGFHIKWHRHKKERNKRVTRLQSGGFRRCCQLSVAQRMQKTKDVAKMCRNAPILKSLFTGNPFDA